MYFSRNNRDFVAANVELTSNRIQAIKRNNNYVLNIFSSIMLGSVLPKRLQPTLLLGQLPNEDSLTRCNTYQLGKKLQWLVKAVKNDPEVSRKFEESFFCQALMFPIFHGDMGINSMKKWGNYRNLSKDPRFKDVNALRAAMVFYAADDSVPIGVNFGKIINEALIGTDENGKYYIRPDSEYENLRGDLIEAVEKFINLLKESKAFNENYERPQSEQELD